LPDQIVVSHLKIPLQKPSRQTVDYIKNKIGPVLTSKAQTIINNANICEINNLLSKGHTMKYITVYFLKGNQKMCQNR